MVFPPSKLRSDRDLDPIACHHIGAPCSSKSSREEEKAVSIIRVSMAMSVGAAPSRWTAAPTSHHFACGPLATLPQGLSRPAGHVHVHARTQRARPGTSPRAREVALSAGSRSFSDGLPAGIGGRADRGREDARAVASGAEVVSSSPSSAQQAEAATSSSQNPYRPEGEEVGECGVDASQRPSHVAVGPAPAPPVFLERGWLTPHHHCLHARPSTAPALR